MIGGSGQAVVQVRWLRPKRARFDPHRWVRRRLKKPVLKRSAPKEGPVGESFECVAWIPQSAADALSTKALWYGYARAANLVLEVIVGGHVDEKDRKRVVKRVLPSLALAEMEGETRWAVFDVNFKVPAEFRLTGKNLQLGDIGLRFDGRGGRRLVVRQVYPAKLALGRREPARWLEFPPFREQRKFRAIGSVEPYAAASYGRTLRGIARHGRKRLPFPLGVLRPRWSVGAVVEDPDLDRLLIAEYDAPREDRESLYEAVAGMNWAIFEEGAGN